ncbi:MAG: class I SAM-dependent methyltransferase [Thermoplasmata archaeon]
MRLENAFTSIFSEYDKMNHFMSLGNDIALRLEAIKNIPENSLVLDAGCGPGIMSKIALLEINPKKIVMLDPNKFLLDNISIDSSKIEKVNGTFENLPFADSYFDAVMCGFSFRDAIDFKKASSELARVIKKDGLLVLVDLGKPDNILRYFFYVYLAIMPTSLILFLNRKKLKDYFTLYKTFRNYITYSEIQTLFKNNGMKLFKFRKILMGGLIYMIWRKE